MRKRISGRKVDCTQKRIAQNLKTGKPMGIVSQIIVISNVPNAMEKSVCKRKTILDGTILSSDTLETLPICLAALCLYSYGISTQIIRQTTIFTYNYIFGLIYNYIVAGVKACIGITTRSEYDKVTIANEFI